MSARPELAALAGRLGIVPSFHDLRGEERRTSDETAAAIVAAMGHDASTEDAARRTREELERLEAGALLDPVQVWREHAADRPRVALRLGDAPRTGELLLEHEDGHKTTVALAARAGTVSVALPWSPPLGYHRVRVELDDGRAGEQRLVVAPRSAPTATERLGARRVFGVAANLYTVRGSQPGFGFGGVAELEELVARVGRLGGDFVGVNPLHALKNRGDSISPYSPVSRLWRNLCYLDLERVPELAASDAARALLELGPVARAREELEEAAHVDYERVHDLKLGVLRELFETFERSAAERPTGRTRAYARFVADGGDALRDFATFAALAARFPEELDWRRWPERYRDPGARAVADFRAEHAGEVELHRWIQFELDRQLEGVAERAREDRLAIGLLGDLAVGAPPDSADAWGFPGLVARGVSIGAPPDAFTADGQDWGLAPLDPNRLRADGYRLWTRLLRSSFRHVGALRIDHAIGIERSFWIPDGASGRSGAYVRQPAEDLLGVLALEARRAGALAIGEDLGVVPDGLKLRLASWGLLSTNVLLFERDGDTFRPPERWSPRTFAAATTHDLPPLEGWARGTDLALRARIAGEDEEALAPRLAERRGYVEALARALDAAGVPRAATGTADDTGSPAPARVHALLARTPAPLLALALDDLLEEREPINLPGVPTSQHRSWSRRAGRTLAALELSPSTLDGRARPVGSGPRAGRTQDVAP